jgi:2-polyprenyl-3-methyl-5-hydroxy-6-metoxy-1,4-benzoquinol methylase
MTTSPFKDPQTGIPLYWSTVGEELVSEAGERCYTLESGVLNLLPKQTKSEDKETSFDYQDHYQKDAEAFDYFAGWEDPAAVHENQRLHQMILAEAPASIKRVLDVGCGAAWVAAHFQNSNAEVYSMDISTVNPEKAVRKYPFPGHFGVVADVFRLPFQASSFDLIVASEIIEHVADPAAFLASLLPALAPGGVLVVTTPHNEKLAYSLCIHCNQPTPHHAHLHSFTADSIRELLPSNLRAGARTKTFMNKFLLHGRTHPLLKHLPFSLWRMVDGGASFFLPKTARLMLVVRRKTL